MPAPTYDVGGDPIAPGSGKTHIAAAIRATASDDIDPTVDHFALALVDGTPYPASGAEAKSWYDTGPGSNNVISRGEALAVPNGTEGEALLTGLQPSTNYDIAHFLGDSTPEYALAASFSIRTRPYIQSVAVAADGVTVTVTFTEIMFFDAGGPDGFELTGGNALTYVSGSGTASATFTAASVVGQGAAVTLSYVQPGDGWQSSPGQIWLLDFSGEVVDNNSTQQSQDPVLTNPRAFDFGVGVVSLAVTTDTGVGELIYVVLDSPDPATGALIADNTASPLVVDSPGEKIFPNVALPPGYFYAHFVHEASEGVLNAPVTTVRFRVPETAAGPLQWSGVATTPAPDTVFPAETQAGDFYFVDELEGEIEEVNSGGSIKAVTATFRVAVQVWHQALNGGLGGLSVLSEAPFDTVIFPEGIASEEAFPSPFLPQEGTINPLGIASAEAFGTAEFFPQLFEMMVFGIASLEAVPMPFVFSPGIWDEVPDPPPSTWSEI